MSELVDRDEIEQIVGLKRSKDWHLGRWVPGKAGGTFYILHSQGCLDLMDTSEGAVDLRDCRFSLALDRGFSHIPRNVPLILWVAAGQLRGRTYTIPEQLMDRTEE